MDNEVDLNEVYLVEKFLDADKRAKELGLRFCESLNGKFVLNGAPAAKGLITLNTLDDVEIFLYGYSLGKKHTNHKPVE